MGRNSAAALADLGPSFPVRDKDGKVVGQKLYRDQHGGVDFEPVGRDLRGNVTQLRAHARVECVLDAYWRRGKITNAQHQAGMLFRGCWLMAASVPKVSADYGERAPKGQGGDEVPAVIAKAKRRLAAMQALLAPSQLLVVIGVCGIDEWAGGTARLRNLCEGLDVIAAHLRIGAASGTTS